MSGGGVPCRAQDGGLQQLLDRIQTVRIRRRIGDLDLAAINDIRILRHRNHIHIGHI